ncbi:MAG TPA: exotoxin A binding domain-containing protein [Kofleriaceae bacterium]|jgi:hypothetical protein|nr:exotoxin A binding domain-containing protein [Kofleriaceae bacterium]
MSIMNLSVSSVPFSIDGTAGIDLIVSVTDAEGAPYTGLQKGNFHVHWILDGGQDRAFASMTVEEFKAVHKLPELPGVYDIEIRSKDMTWTPTSSNISFFCIAVKEDKNHGQTLYTVEDPSIALAPS